MDTLPEVRWKAQDDLCDCDFQRIYWATNPYIGRTLEVRLCCAWKRLAELHPEIQEFMREVPGFYNSDTDRYQMEPADWDGDYDMPRSIWYRHLAAKLRRPLEAIRREYDHLMPPKGKPKAAHPTRATARPAPKVNIEAVNASYEPPILKW